VLTITFSPSSTITYGTTSNVSCSANTAQVSPQLFRDGASVGNPDVQTLAVGSYLYVCNNTATQNYTSASTSNTLTINKATSAIDLKINGLDGGQTAERKAVTNFTANLTTPSNGTVNITENGALLASGSSALSASKQYNATGTFTIAANFAGNSNYNSSTESATLTVQDTTPPGQVGDFGETAVDTSYITWSWTNPTDDDFDHVEVYLNGAFQANTSAAIFNATGLSDGTTYTLTLRTADSYGNINPTNVSDGAATAPLPSGVTISPIAGKITNRTIIAAYSIIVNNTGQKTDNFTLALTNLDAASTASLNQTSFIGVQPNQTISATLSVTDDDTTGVYRVKVNATSARNASVYDEETIETTVYGKLFPSITSPTGQPIVNEGLNITLQGRVIDELGVAVSGASVTFEPINDTLVYLCSTSVEQAAGNYSCTMDTSGMAATVVYDVRINASKAFYHAGTNTSQDIFILGASQEASLSLQKIANVLSISASQIAYNISLVLTNAKGTSTNTTINDPNATSSYAIGTIGSQTVLRNYTLTFARGAADRTIQLAAANATGYDSLYSDNLLVQSNAPLLVIPQNITAAKLTLIKNIVFLTQSATNITYKIVDEVINSGGEDLSTITFVDSDINTSTIISSLIRGASRSFEGNVTLSKTSQNLDYTFAKATASANATIFESNQPKISIPGYGGPFDVVITSLPGSVTTGGSITGTIELINQNPDVADDRVMITQVKDSSGTILDQDIRTVYVGRNSSATFSVSLNVPSSAGSYIFFTKITWPAEGQANASKSFAAVSPPAATTATSGAGGGAGTGFAAQLPREPSCGDSLCNSAELSGEIFECVADCGYDCNADGIRESWSICLIAAGKALKTVPQELLDDLILLRNKRTELSNRASSLKAAGVDTSAIDSLISELESLLEEAELRAALGDLEGSRNVVRTAFGKLATIIVTPMIVAQPTGAIVISPEAGLGILGGLLGLGGAWALRGRRFSRPRLGGRSFGGRSLRGPEDHEEDAKHHIAGLEESRRTEKAKRRDEWNKLRHIARGQPDYEEEQPRPPQPSRYTYRPDESYTSPYSYRPPEPKPRPSESKPPEEKASSDMEDVLDRLKKLRKDMEDDGK
jgi:hypothetical protein